MEYFDPETDPFPELNGITNAIIGAAIAVHRELGPGFDEAVYEEALAIEFAERVIKFSRQHSIAVMYHDRVVGRGRLDFLVDGRIILELKAVDALGAIHTAQAMSYLRATKLKLALIINFNVKLLKDGIRRVAL